MIKISEFTPCIAQNKESTSNANCKVIINNNTERITDQEISYPSVKTRSVEAPVMGPKDPGITSLSLDASVPMYTPAENAVDTDKELYHHLAKSFSRILKTNNPSLIANLIDQSGKVILSADDLATAISLTLGIDLNGVRINYENPDAGCLGRINPIKRITAIKVNGYDFNLMYNRQYNNLSDEFGISMTKCLILL